MAQGAIGPRVDTPRQGELVERVTPDNCALHLIDHQVGLYTGVRDMPVETLKNNVVGRAKAANGMNLPIDSAVECSETASAIDVTVSA
jgi:hypothetical protein